MSNDKEHDDGGFNFDNVESDSFDTSFDEHEHDEHHGQGDEHVEEHYHENFHEDEHEQGEHYHENGNEHEHENNVEDEPVSKKKKNKKGSSSSSGLKKFIKPLIGGVALIGCLFVGYNYYKSTLSNSTSMTPNHLIAHNATPPKIPHNLVANTNMDSGFVPKQNIPGPGPLMMQHPKENPAMEQAGLQNKPLTENTENTQNLNIPVSGPKPILNPVENVSDAPRNNKDDGDEINTHLTELIAVTKNLDTDLSVKFSQMTDKLSETSQAITTRLDKTDDNVSALTTHVNELDTKINGFDKQLKDIQGGSLQHNTITSNVKKDIHVTKRHIEHKNRPVQHKVDLNGFVVRGVEKGDTPQSAWIQTPSGYQVVHIGEQNVSGMGTIKAIRPKGETWIVETSNGIISP